MGMFGSQNIQDLGKLWSQAIVGLGGTGFGLWVEEAGSREYSSEGDNMHRSAR